MLTTITNTPAPFARRHAPPEARQKYYKLKRTVIVTWVMCGLVAAIIAALQPASTHTRSIRALTALLFGPVYLIFKAFGKDIA